MLNKSVFKTLTTTPGTHIKINDMISLESFRDLLFKDKIHVSIRIKTGYKYETALSCIYPANTDSINAMIDSIRAAIREHGEQITENIILQFNKDR